VVKALKDYTDPYVKGCVPPSATTWKDPVVVGVLPGRGRRRHAALDVGIGVVLERLDHALAYTDPYVKGCVPPSATTWKDPDNNVAFHNRTTVMTHNGLPSGRFGNGAVMMVSS
jgi:hypothetical protein